MPPHCDGLTVCPRADVDALESDATPRTAILLAGRDIPLLATFKILLRGGDRVAATSSMRGFLRRLARCRPVLAMIDDSIELHDVLTIIECLRRRGPCSVIIAYAENNEDLILRQGPVLRPTAVLVRPLDVNDTLERLAFLASERGVALSGAPLSRYVSKAVTFVARQYRDLSLRAIAAASGVSSGYLAELFRAQVGITVGEYVTALRLEMAKELLVETTYKLERIAAEIGFSDGPHLARVFRSRFGCSPGAYRQGVLGGTVDEEVFSYRMPERSPSSASSRE